MDINSLLSPSETPRSVASTPSSPQQSPFKFVQRTQSGPGPFKHGLGTSPLSQSVMNQSSIPAHVLSSTSQQVSSPLISPVPATNSAQLTRSVSSPSIETLTDLASLQNQNNRSTPANVRNRDNVDVMGSPTMPNLIVTASLTSNPRASFDINMMEVPKQTGRTDFTGTSLKAAQQERLKQLTKYIQDAPSVYESHVEIVKILHQGFIDHIYPPADSNTRRDPHKYDLLADLRDARENMVKLFAAGEELWIDWLQDESILARTAEERIAVIEKFRRAVGEEAGSIPLWLAYGDWVRHCHDWAHDGSQEQASVSGEERAVGREIFTWDLVLETWQEAVDQTQSNIVESHTVWIKYLDTQIPDLQQKVDDEKVAVLTTFFEQRLRTPHAAWDETFQLFSSFVSANYDSEQYERIMLATSRAAADTKKQWALRDPFENVIAQAQKAQDRDAEYYAFLQYIQWEQTPEKGRKVNYQLASGVLERAELRFPTDAALWEEHVAFLLSIPESASLPVLDRATKHCPWSGALWSQYLLSSERAGQSFPDTEGIKHKATNTGLLEAAGMEEVITVHGAWCSYLRRRSFRPDAGEEDLDVAEMGIRSSIEGVASLAAKLGLGDMSDPAFGLHRIYITFLSESGRWDNARQEFDNSVRDYGGSWQFWMLFYNWEMGRWRRFASNQHDASEESLAILPPHLATAVLKKALEQPNLDYPEAIMDALITHCEDFEDAEELQSAQLKVRKLRKAVVARRQLEAETSAETTTMSANVPVDLTQASHTLKRKRDETDENDSNKRNRNIDVAHQSVEQPDVLQPKRDRENATILVENLPANVTDNRIRQYFNSCGPIRTLTVSRAENVSAIIEFEDDIAARYALSRDEHELDDSIISVTLDTGSTLYLTNYKPSADEPYIRALLQEYGDITSVRFPSLQGNKTRRFCYVKFQLPSEAQTACAALDQQKVDGLILTCKISNPARRQTRQDTQINDGHTVFVGQLSFKATEEELEKPFSEYGTIVRIRMPLHPSMKNRNKGIAYITYESLKEAELAVSAMNGYSLRDRSLTVELADAQKSGSQRQGSRGHSESVTQNGDRASSVHRDPQARRELQVFLTNVPDTVNEARIREIAQQSGTVVRIILKTNHQGAILEYSEAKEAGTASLRLDGFEIIPGRELRVVSEKEMRAETREKKPTELPLRKQKAGPSNAGPIGRAGPVKRPQQQSNRRKGGHLGQRNDAVRHDNSNVAAQSSKGSSEMKKSNDDFRDMLKRAG